VEVAFDGSPLAWRAVEAAAGWARQLDATPWITRVDDLDRAPLPADVNETSGLLRAAARLEELGARAEWDVLHGDQPGRAVAYWGAAHGVALYVAGAHSRSGIRELFVGSAANDLVHAANRPVLIAGPASL
jgi:nucleotide-binding universal stress UspA family protein